MSETVEAWVTGYRKAWETNETDDIQALFTEDAEYRTEPYSDPWRGHDEIVDGWLEAADEPGETIFDWSELVSVGDLGIVQATTAYAGRSTYSNLWVIRFAPDGRAREFTEWWMAQPGTSNPEPEPTET
jgi:ketosteroid isomerase-like protein